MNYIWVKAPKGKKCLKEGIPLRWIDDKEPVKVLMSTHYQRCINRNELIVCYAPEQEPRPPLQPPKIRKPIIPIAHLIQPVVPPLAEIKTTEEKPQEETTKPAAKKAAPKKKKAAKKAATKKDDIK